MRKRRFWGTLALLLAAVVLLGACGVLQPVQALFFGFNAASGAGKTLTEPAGVDYAVCRLSYASLTPVQRRAYRTVYNALPGQPERISLPFMEENALAEVMAAVKTENPQILCLGEAYAYRAAGRTLWLYPTYRAGKAECAEKSARLLDAARRIAAAAAGEPDDFRKELLLHDSLVSVCDYGEGLWADTAFGALVEGRARCGGYTAAMKLLCDLCGLPSAVVSGTAANETETEPHVWNAVALDGLWYYTDVTWDDPVSGGVRHDYLNVCEKELSRTHGGYTLPGKFSVNGGSADYFKRSGLYCTDANWKRVVSAALTDALKTGGPLELKFSSAALCDRACSALFSDGLLESLAAGALPAGEALHCTYSRTEDVRVLHIQFDR